MTTQAINWCTPTQLACWESVPIDAYIRVPSALLATPPEGTYGYLTAHIDNVRAATNADTCCGMVYTLSYDDAQLAEGYSLRDIYISFVFCADCVMEFFMNGYSGSGLDTQEILELIYERVNASCT